MKQLIIIGGGEVHQSQEDYYQFLRDFELLDLPGKGSWKEWIVQACSIQYKVWKPQMPATWRADYEAWRIWFEKMRPDTDTEGVVLVGFSLGAMFWMRYLSENIFDGQIEQLHLIAGGRYDSGYGGFCLDPNHIDHLRDQCDEIFIYHSEDDWCVPFDHGQRLAEALPDAHFEQFATRGHFLQPAFPELLANIGCYQR